MKNVLKFCIGALLGFALVYLIGSFYGMSFSPSMWTPETRLTTSIMGTIMGISLGASTCENPKLP